MCIMHSLHGLGVHANQGLVDIGVHAAGVSGWHWPVEHNVWCQVHAPRLWACMQCKSASCTSGAFVSVVQRVAVVTV